MLWKQFKKLDLGLWKKITSHTNDGTGWYHWVEAHYLMGITICHSKQCSIVYLGKTRIYPHYTEHKCWQSNYVTGVKTYDSPKEKTITNTDGYMWVLSGIIRYTIFKRKSMSNTSPVKWILPISKSC
jgi:hypothetical protein